MKTFLRLFNPRLVALANVEESAAPSFITFFNETPTAFDREKLKKAVWVQIAPYGEHSHSQGMQIFHREDAEQLIANFEKGLGGIGRKTFGLPWYIGHPDHPAFAKEFPDTRAYGRIKKLRAGASGLEGQVTFHNSGRALLEEEAFDGHSPNWSAEKINGAWRPRVLNSVGWTNNPNIDVMPALPNTRTNQKQEMDKFTKILLALANARVVGSDATEDDIPGAIEKLIKKLDALANEKTELETKLKEATANLAKLETLANERKAMAESAVDAAIGAQKITPAERDAKIKGITEAEDFAQALANVQALVSATPPASAPKTASAVPASAATRTSTDGGTMTAFQRVQAIAALANAKKAQGMSHDDAHRAVRLDPQNAHLFPESEKVA